MQTRDTVWTVVWAFALLTIGALVTHEIHPTKKLEAKRHQHPSLNVSLSPITHKRTEHLREEIPQLPAQAKRPRPYASEQSPSIVDKLRQKAAAIFWAKVTEKIDDLKSWLINQLLDDESYIEDPYSSRPNTSLKKTKK